MSFADRPKTGNASHPTRATGPANTHPAIASARAFTLIELLVVISILVFLMAILLPTLGRVRKQAQATACRANLRQWGLFYGAYTAANDGKMAPVVDNSAGKWWLYYAVPGALPTELRQSIRLALRTPRDLHVYEDLLLCPAARILSDTVSEISWSGYTYAPWEEKMKAESAPGSSVIVSSYGQNAWMPTDGPVGRPRWLTCLVKEASRVPVYLDSRQPFGAPEETDPPPDYEDLLPPLVEPCAMPSFAMNRHHGGINALFMDWSVRKVGIKELWALKWIADFNTAGPWTKAGGVQPEDWPKWMRKFKDY